MCSTEITVSFALHINSGGLYHKAVLVVKMLSSRWPILTGENDYNFKLKA